MGAVGSERAALMGMSEGGPMSLLFAATYPERTVALVLYGTLACGRRDMDYPHGCDEAFAELYRVFDEGWGRAESLRVFAQSLADDELAREDFGRIERSDNRVLETGDDLVADLRPGRQRAAAPQLGYRMSMDSR